MTVQHWNSMTEAQKLTNSELIPGVIETQIYREPLLPRMPVALARGLEIKFNRENKTLEGDVSRFSVGDTTNWTSSMTYEQVTRSLKRCYIARLLNNFIPDVYGTINNYEAQMLMEAKKGVFLFLNDRIIYDDTTYGGDSQVDGLHALAEEGSGYLDIDGGETAFSLTNLRLMLNAMKGGCDIIYLNSDLAIYFDQAYEERGFAALATASAGTFSLLTRAYGEQGKPIIYFAGVPLVRTDFLTTEQANTGAGSNARAKYSSGTAQYTVFGIKFGNVYTGNPGLMMGFGHPEMLSKLYKLIYHEKMPNFVDSKGIELVTYFVPILGSPLSLGRIYDVTMTAITA